MKRPFWETVAGLGLIGLGVLTGVASGDAFIPLLLSVGGFYLLARQFYNANTRSAVNYTIGAGDRRPMRDTDDDYGEVPRKEQQIYAHAVRAVRAAGNDPGETQVLPVDIGVMSFSGSQPPMIHRSQSVPDDVDYIQPFVQLRLPQRAVGRVRFEIADSDGQVVYIHEDFHQLERGRNLVTPTTRLPIHDAQAMYYGWTLSVSADDVLLAAHKLEWQATTTRVIRNQLSEDGEISSEMRAMLHDNELRGMSLDELLEFQEEDDAARR